MEREKFNDKLVCEQKKAEAPAITEGMEQVKQTSSEQVETSSEQVNQHIPDDPEMDERYTRIFLRCVKSFTDIDDPDIEKTIQEFATDILDGLRFCRVPMWGLKGLVGGALLAIIIKSVLKFYQGMKKDNEPQGEQV